MLIRMETLLSLKGENELCLSGLSGDNMNSISQEVFTIDNHSFIAGYKAENYISMPDSGIILDSQELLFPFARLGSNYNGTCDDIGNLSPPRTVVNNTTIWDLRVLQFGLYDLNNVTDEIELFAEVGSQISDCTEDYLPQKYNVLEGPDLIVYKNEIERRDGLGNFSY